jgi:small-conductance mechanosensitive channel
MLQFFTVFTLVFPIAGASAHFSPAWASKVRINRVFAHFRWPNDLKSRICSSYLQFSSLFFQLLERLLIFRLPEPQECA